MDLWLQKCGLWPYITGWSGWIHKKNYWYIEIVVLNAGIVVDFGKKKKHLKKSTLPRKKKHIFSKKKYPFHKQKALLEQKKST